MSEKVIYRREILPRRAFFRQWEKIKIEKLQWFIECFSEALGVFFYVYAGVGATATFSIGNLLKEPLGSIFQIGFAYAIGSLLGIVICGAARGCHLSPCITIAQCVFHKFPKWKAVRFIIAQILGAYIASLLVYAQYRPIITGIEAGLAAKGELAAIQFTSSGTAGIFALYLRPGAPVGVAFLNEWVMCVFMGLVVWACIDPTNIFVPPTIAPWVISFAYATSIWGYSPNGLSLNTARDVGGRMAMLTIYGTKAAGGAYGVISALTNIPATLFAVLLYELFLVDSDLVITKPHIDYIFGRTNFGRNPANASISTTRLVQEKTEESRLP